MAAATLVATSSAGMAAGGPISCSDETTTSWIPNRCPLEPALRADEPGSTVTPTGPVTLRTHNIEYALGGGFHDGSPTDAEYDNHRAAVTESLLTDRASIVCMQEFYDIAMAIDLNGALPPEQQYRYIAGSAMTRSWGDDLFDFRNETPELPRETETVHNLQGFNGTFATLTGPGHAGLVRPPYRFELMLLSDYPIVEALELEIVTMDGAHYHRGGLIARIDVPGPDLYLANVHLATSYKPPQSLQRRDATILVLEQLRLMAERSGDDWTTAPAIICGDFNGYPAGLLEPDGSLTTARRFEEQAKLEGAGFRCTWIGVPADLDPSVTPNRYTRYEPGLGSTLDHIWTRNLPANDDTVAVRVDGSGSPDHTADRSGLPGVVSDHWAAQITIAPRCTGDLDGDGGVGTSDLLSVLSAWGPCDGCGPDLDDSGAVDAGDLLTILAAWGDC